MQNKTDNLTFARHAMAICLLAVASTVSFAQTPPPQGSLMQQMVTQPPVDISAPVVATAWFDPPAVRPGEKAVYRVTLNAIEVSVRWPEQIPVPAGLTARLNAHGQMLQPMGSVFRPYSTFLYDVRAARPGFFTMPAFYVDVYGKRVLIPEADLEVVEELPPSHEPVRQLEIECDATHAFIGQPLTVRVLLFASKSNVVMGVTQLEFTGDGFLENKSTVKRSITPVERKGVTRPAYIYETRVMPIASGRQQLTAKAFSAGNDFGGPIVIQGNVTIPAGAPRYLLLDSEPVTVNVRPLPVEGRLPGFNGAVGDFSIDPPQIATNTVRVGDPVQLTVTIRGDGDLSRVQAPLPPVVRDWQVFPAVSAGIFPGNRMTNPAVVFNYTLIALTDETRQTPRIPFAAFDPLKAAYVDLTIPSLPVKTVATGLPADWQEFQTLSGRETEREKKPALSGLTQSRGRVAAGLKPVQLSAWFPLLMLAPMAGAIGLWLWDKRRRFLEQHPEIVRRRIARRQFRRQKRLLKRAATSGDVGHYAHCAVTTIQVACAPHFPAHPHALVCADVLSRLDSNDQQGRLGETVRRVFAIRDGSRFATMPQAVEPVAAMETDVDALLLRLEEEL